MVDSVTGFASDVPLFLAFLAVLTVSYIGVAIVRYWAWRLEHVAIPNERSSHTLPMPMGGGLVLVAINVAVWVLFIRAHQYLSWQHMIAFAAGGLLVAGISFVDDLGHVDIRVRLLFQALASIVFILGVASWNIVDLPLIGQVNLGVAGGAVTLIWIVGLINSYNFMDGIDGMVGGQALAAGLGWTLLGGITHHAAIAVCGLVLAASSLGFLVHNWHPATIFMGDVGATFLGYSFAALAVVGATYDSRLALAGVLLVWPALFDSGFTVLRRLRHGESITTGHRTFLFHRLVLSGWSHTAAASLYIPLPIIGALFAIFWQYGNPVLHSLVILLLCAACASLWLLVCRQEKRLPLEGQEPVLLHREHAASTDELPLARPSVEAS